MTASPAGALAFPPISVPPLPDDDVTVEPVEVVPVEVGAEVGPVEVGAEVGTDEAVNVDANVGVDLGPEAPIGPITIDLGAGADEDGITGGVTVDDGTPTAEPAPLPAAPTEAHAPSASTSRGSATTNAAETPQPALTPSLAFENAAPAIARDRTLGSLREINVSGSLEPRAEGFWSNIGHVTGRFGPWFALVGLAFVVQLVARSALRDRQRLATG